MDSAPTIAAPLDPEAPRARFDRSAPGAGPARVLMVTHRTPFPPDKGDRIRSYHILRHLASQASVDLATLADEPVSAETAAELGRLTRRLAVIPTAARLRWVRATASLAMGKSATEGLFQSRALARLLRQWTGENAYDMVFVVCSSMAPYLKSIKAPRATTVVDLIDVDSQKWLDYAAAARGPKRFLYKLEARRVRALEASLVDKCDRITLVSEAEADCFRAFAQTDKVIAVPNGVDLEYFRPDPLAPEIPDSCVFVGAMDYKPNIDAVCWFCQEVWPQVRALRPKATFTIVGRRPVEAVRRCCELPGVTVMADVPDVRPYLHRAAVVVAPLRIARGVQNKVLEALACGKAVVASPQAIDGLDVTIGTQLEEAESANEWAVALDRLMCLDAERHVLGAGAREFVQERHAWSACLRQLDGSIAESLCPPRMAIGRRYQPK